jgi:hypothetical protein
MRRLISACLSLSLLASSACSAPYSTTTADLADGAAAPDANVVELPPTDAATPDATSSTADAKAPDASADANAPDASADASALDASADTTAPTTTADAGEAGDDGTTPEGGAEAGCPSPSLVCAGACVPSDAHNCGSCGNDCANLPHVSAASCTGGACSFPASACTPGWADCDGNPSNGCETDLSAPATCGSCTTACGANAPQCAPSGAGYACVTGCPSSAPVLCSSACVDTTSSASHCGSCDTSCAGGETCQSGACACPSGQTFCANGCTTTATDDANCGTCGQACSGGETCQSGACVCPSGQTYCGSTCTTTATDDANCGACGNACRGGETCQSGGCVCPSGQTYCGSGCTPTATDDANCGACGHACTGGETCQSGACVCPSGQTYCGSTCTTTATDDANCGTCGHACTGGETCQSGVCACPSGETLCSGVCVAESTDANNCGACGHGCLGGACSAGACQPVVLATPGGAVQEVATDGTSVYWTDSLGTSSSSVGRCTIASCASTVTSLATGLGPVLPVAVDPNTPTLLFGEIPQNGSGGGLWEATSTGTGGKTQAWGPNIGEVDAIWIAPSSVYFWAGIKGGVYISNGVGSYVENVFTGGCTIGVATDADYVYATDHCGNRLLSCGIHATCGSSPTVIATGVAGANQLYDDGAALWMTAEGTAANSFTDGALYKCSATSCAVFASGQVAPSGLVSDGTNVYWTSQVGGAIMRSPVGAAAPVKVAASPQPLGITQTSNSILWADQKTGSVYLLAK